MWEWLLPAAQDGIHPCPAHLCPEGKSAPLPSGVCPLAGRAAPGCAGAPQGGDMRSVQSLCILSPSLTPSQHPLHWIPGEFPFLGSSALLKPGTLLTQTLISASPQHFLLSLFPPSTCSSKGTPVLPASSVCCYGNCCHK